MASEQENPGAELIAELVGEAPLALPESISALEDAMDALEDELQEAGAKAAVSGKRGGKV